MEDYEIQWGKRTTRSVTPSRHLRAVSAAPEYSDEIGEMDGYFLNSGLYRAKRAISEARDLLRESSMARESSVMESRETQKLKRSHLEKIQESSSALSSGAQGSYKITVTPKVEQEWSTTLPDREWVSPNTALTAKLLEAYNPSKYPDFIFGKYQGTEKHLQKPISATMSYMDESPSFFDRESIAQRRAAGGQSALTALSSSSDYKMASSNLADSSSLAQKTSSSRATSRARSMARDYSGLSDYNTLASNQQQSKSSSSYLNDRAEQAAENYHKNYFSGSYDHSTDSAYLGDKARRRFKYYHLLIPKHYPGTPMLGGYLLPQSSQYTWRY